MIFLAWGQSLYSADYYWVGGSGKWTDYKNHWVTTSGGSTFCKLVPTSLDNVHFDSKSFSASGQSVTLDSAAFCHDMDWTGTTNSPTLKFSNTFNVFGSLKLIKNMSVSGNSDILFRASSGSNIVQTGGKTFSNNISFTGAGTWVLKDSLLLTVSKTYTLLFSAGNFYAGSGAISAYWLRTDGTATRSLHLGTSTVKAVAIVDSTSTGMTFNGDTSDVYITKDGSYIYGTAKMTFYNVTVQKYGWIENGSAMSFNNVLYQKDGYVWNGATYNFKKLTLRGNTSISTACNIDSLILGAGMSYGFGGTLNIKYDFDANGTCGKYITMSGSPTSISSSSATISVSYAIMYGIKGTGGATFTANNTYDLGKNTGWTINVPKSRNLYWIGNSGNWGDGKHWSTTSGGTASGCVPADSDNVIFDANSFTKASQTVSLDIDGLCNSMDWTGSKNSPTLTRSVTAASIILHGSLTFIKNMSTSQFYGYFTSDRKGNKITMAGQSFDYSVTFDGKGSWYLQDSFNTSDNIYLNGGDVYTKSHALACSSFQANGSNKSSLTLGRSRMHCVSFTESSSGTFKLNSDTSLIVLNNAGSYIRTVVGYKFHNVLFTTSSSFSVPYTYGTSSATYNKLTFVQDGNITSSNTIDTLVFSPGYSYSLTSSCTQKILDTFICNGTCSKQITLSGGSSTTSSISKSSGNVTVDFVSMSYIKGTGGATFTANHSLDLGGNSGWTFVKTTGKDFYWVGNTGKWSDGKHWALTSGGAGSGCVPGDSDNVYFDANSFSVASTVTVDISAHCRNMDWTGSKKSPTFSQSNDININGSLTFIKAMTFTYNTLYGVNFLASNKGNTVTSASHDFYSVSFGGSGAWDLLDSLSTTTSSGSINIQSGTFNSRGYHMRTYFMYIGGVTANCKINLGSSRIILAFFTEASNSKLKFSADSSTFRFYGINASLNTTDNLIFYNAIFVNSNDKSPWYCSISSSGKLTFNKLTFRGNGTISSSNTFDTLFFNAGKNYIIQSGSTQTVNYKFFATSTCYYMNISSSSSGTSATIKDSKDTVSINYVNMQDIHATGGAVFIANKSNNLGNNSGWTFNSAGHIKYYWVGNTGKWSDGKHWALSSGGPGCGCIPTDSDDVFFDANSFSASGKKVSVDSSSFCRNMDWTGATNNPTYELDTSGNYIYGSLKFISAMSLSGQHTMTFASADTGNTITTAGLKLPGSLDFEGPGSYKLLDSLNSKTHGTLSIGMGTFNTNGKSIYNFGLAMDGTNKGNVHLGSSNLNLDWVLYSGGTSLKFNADSSTIKMGDKNSFIWSNQNLKFHTVYFTNKSGSITINDASTTTQKFTFSKLRFGGDATVYTSNTEDTLIGDPGNTFKFGAGQTQTINSKLNIFGSPFGLCILESTVTGKQTTFYKKYDTICIELTYFKDTKATGGASFVAGNNCVDLGNNNGWSFSKGFSCLPRKIYTSKISGNVFCAGSSVYVPYTLLGNFNPTNNFIVQLSDSSGSFLSPDSLGYKATNLADSIKVQIPINTIGGSHYRIRVVSDGPIVKGTNNGMDLTINPAPVANAGPGIQGICKGLGATLGAKAVSGSTYSWKSNPAGFSSSSANPLAYPTVKTIYTLTEKITATGCTRSNDDTVLIAPAPTVLPGKNQTVCAGASAIIGDTAGKGYIYSWTSNPAGYTSTKAKDTVHPKVTTVYYLSAKMGMAGCTKMDSVTITVIPIPSATTGGNKALCFGKFYKLGAATAAGHTYSWTSNPPGFTSSFAAFSITASTNITYYLTESYKGCTNKDSAIITVNPLPAAKTGGNQWLCYGDTVFLGDTAVSGNTYSWTSKPAGFTSKISNPYALPLSSTTYYLTETNSTTGCSKSDTAFITKYPLLNPPALSCVDIVSNGKLRLGISPATYAKGGFLSYRIYRSTAATGPFTFVDSIKSSSATSYIDSNVSNVFSTQYYYYITTKNSCNVEGTSSDTVNSILLSSSMLSDKRVSLSWNTQKPYGKFYYRILIDDGAGFKLIDSTTSLTYQLAACYRKFKAEVQVASGGCTSTSNPTGSILLNDNTAPHISNNMLNASVVNNARIDIDFLPSDSNDSKYYRIYCSINGAAFALIDSIKNNKSASYHYTHTKLNTLSNNYTYKITASDSCGNKSVYSNTQSPVQLGAIPGQMEVDLQWRKYRGYILDTVEIQKYNGSKWVTVAYAKTTDSTYKDTNVACDLIYSYRIVSHEAAGNNQVSYSDSAAAKPFNMLRPAPPIQNYSSVIATNKVKISWQWNRATHVKSFEIWKQTNDTGAYSKAGIVAFDSIFIDTKVQTLINSYSFYVIAVDSCSANIHSYPSDTHHIILQNISSGGSCKPEAKLSWNLYKGLSNPSKNVYTIYRSKNGAAFKSIYSTTIPASVFVDTTVIENNRYTYKITVADPVSGVSSSSDTINIVPNVFPRPLAIALKRTTVVRTGANGSILLEWDKCKNGDTVALGYNVYHSMSDGGPYTLIHIENDTSKTSFVHAHINTVSFPHYYYVVPFNKCKLEAFPLDTHKVVRLTAKNNNLQVHLNWNQYLGFPVDSVKLFRSVNGAVPILVYKNFTAKDTAFTDNNIRCGQIYAYSIMMREKGGGYITYSDSIQLTGRDSIPPSSSDMLVTSVTNTDRVNGAISIKFNGVSESNRSGYAIFRSTDSSNFTMVEMLPDTNRNGITWKDSMLNTMDNHYLYYVISLDSCGNAAMASDTHEVVLLKANPTDGKVNLSWSAYRGWNNWTYKLERRLKNTSWQGIALLTSTDHYFVDSTATCNVRYSYRITAVNGVGAIISYSNIEDVMTFNHIPPDPAILSRVSVEQTGTGSGAVSIHWKPSSSRDIDNYLIYANGRRIVVPGLDSVYNDINLNTYNKTYTYSIYSLDSCGNSSDDPFADHRSILLKAAAGNQENNISWSKYEGFTVTNYSLYRDGLQIAALNSSDTSYADTMVICDRIYKYRIMAAGTEAAQISFSNYDSVRTVDHMAPRAVHLVTATFNDEANKVLVYWNKSTNYDAHNYRLFRRIGTLGEARQIATPVITDTMFVDSISIAANTPLYYYVQVDDYCNNRSMPSNDGSTIILKGHADNLVNSISWNAYRQWQNGVDHYNIYRKEDSAQWKMIGTDTALSFKDDKLDDFIRDHCYRVEAIEKNGRNATSISSIVCLEQNAIVWMPNAFTPKTSQGLNDVFAPQGTYFDKYEMSIYDRWGELIYHTTEGKGWDGSVNGQIVLEGVYIYIISVPNYNSLGNTYRKKGNLLIFR